MRCLAALQTCLAVVLAFFVAPFQHVHPGSGPGADHDQSGILHANFHAPTRAVEEQHGLEVVGPDDDHDAVWSLDTFTLVLTTSLAPFVPSRGPVLLFAPPTTFEPVEVVEERGHDPPAFAVSIPRAPPS